MKTEEIKNATRLLLIVQKQTKITPYAINISSGINIVLQGHYNSGVAKFLNTHADRWSFEFFEGYAQWTRFVGIYKIEITLT
jgi:hypothetical protein